MGVDKEELLSRPAASARLLDQRRIIIATEPFGYIIEAALNEIFAEPVTRSQPTEHQKRLCGPHARTPIIYAPFHHWHLVGASLKNGSFRVLARSTTVIPLRTKSGSIRVAEALRLSHETDPGDAGLNP